MDINSLLKYEESSNSCLVWKSSRGRIKSGDTAGFLHKDKDWIVKICGKKYQASRLMMILNGHSLSDNDVIDHINGDSTDNRLVNLRICNQTINNRNRKLYSNNTSTKCGIEFYLSRGETLFVKARWYDNNRKRFSRYFNVNELGLMVAFRDATIYRQTMLNELNLGIGAYTERHGLQEKLNNQ